MRYLLDTNIIIEAVAGSPPAIDVLHQATLAELAAFSAITRIELFGYPELTNEEELALTVVTEELEEIAVTHRIVDRTIRLRQSYSTKIPDAIIAASAQELEAILVTRNVQDFCSISGLRIFNPWD